MVSVDKDKCIGCGACESVCGAAFKLVDGKSKYIAKGKPPACVKQAAESCPVGAITV